jgi:hypothetical protein
MKKTLIILLISICSFSCCLSFSHRVNPEAMPYNSVHNPNVHNPQFDAGYGWHTRRSKWVCYFNKVGEGEEKKEYKIKYIKDKKTGACFAFYKNISFEYIPCENIKDSL